MVRSVTKRPGESANHSRAVPAISPHVPSLQKAMTLKISPKTKSCTVTLPLLASTKWGKTAAKNTSDFGFNMPTVKPWRTMVALRGRSPSRLAIAMACAWRWRNAPIPNQMRYAPPAIWSVMENAFECANNGPSPTATITESTSVPSELPSTVSTATVRPQATPRANVNKTLGPGTMMMAIDATKNVTNCPPSIMAGRAPTASPPRG